MFQRIRAAVSGSRIGGPGSPPVTTRLPGSANDGDENHDGRSAVARVADARPELARAAVALGAAEADLTAGTGKMHSATVQRWLIEAGSLLAQTQQAQTQGHAGPAAAYAATARALAGAATLLMAQAQSADAAYQDGNYNAAHDLAAVAGSLLEVVDDLLALPAEAMNTNTNTNTRASTVPARELHTEELKR